MMNQPTHENPNFILLETWLKTKQLQKKSAHTILAYRRDLTNFLEFCHARHLSLLHLDYADLQEYLVCKIEQDQLQNRSLQRRLSAIRQFLYWLNQQHQPSSSSQTSLAIKDIKIRHQRQTLPGLLDVQVIHQLLDQAAPHTEKQAQLWIRDKAILELFYSSGLRLSELQQLNLNHFDFEQNMIYVLGKGQKQRILPFGSLAKHSLNQWFILYQRWSSVPFSFDDRPAFISLQGHRLSTRQIENRVKYQAQRANIPVNLHPHLLRHCFASHVLARSGNLRAVQEFLGHEHLSTTAIYTHLNFDELKQKYQQFHPRAKQQH